MPYNITRFNGVKVATVEDGTVDNTLDIKLVGKNYAGYGEIQNENMVHMLENFASTTAPPRKITGQLWYDSLGKKLKFYDGTQFRTTGGAEVGNTQPSGLSQGDFWFNTSTNQLFAWDGDEYILVGPQAVENAGATELRSISVIDSNNISRPIVTALVNNAVVFIISNNAFTLRNDSTLRPEFIEIKKGITLSNSSTGISTSDWIHWGTASSALGLVDTDGSLLTANNLVRSNNVNFAGLVKFKDAGYLLGDSEDIKFFIDNDVPVLASLTNDAGLVFKSKVSSSTSLKIPMKLLGSDILPGTPEISKVGITGSKFSEMHAGKFVGSLEGTAREADKMLADGSYRIATADADDDTIVVRDGTGAITATAFIGQTTSATNLAGGAEGSVVYQSASNITAFLPRGASGSVLTINSTNQLAWTSFNSLLPTSVAATTLNVSNETNAGTFYLTFVNDTGDQSFKIQKTKLSYNPANDSVTASFFDGKAATAAYADLAEKYLADREYEVGTVVMVGGEKEVTACSVGHRAIGAVSANPAYLMNKDLEGGTNIALKGRVPIKVKGPVLKGQRLVAGENGSAIVDFAHTCEVFAIALESSDKYDVKLIESVIL
jgi:hypothetical protein